MKVWHRVFCDGSFRRSDGRAGVGVVSPVHNVKAGFRCRAAGSFEAEFNAVWQAAGVAKAQIQIESDCQGVVHLINNFHPVHAAQPPTKKILARDKRMLPRLLALKDRMDRGEIRLRWLPKGSSARKSGGAHAQAHSLAFKAYR